MADVKRLQIRRDTLADWVSVNPILLEGEVGLIIENGGISSLKIGDGVSSFTQLKQLILLEAVFGGYVSRQDLSASLRDYATIQYVDSEIDKILGGASGAYDTLKEIEDILKNDTTGLAALLTEIGTKADTSVVDALDSRVAANEADLKQLNITVDTIYEDYAKSSDIPTKTSQLYDDIGYALAVNIKALAGLDIVTKDYIADEAVTTSKIKDGAITSDKLSTAIQQQLSWIPSTTDDLTEGSSNLYFTNARAVAALDGASLNSLKVGGYGVSENIQALIQSAAAVSGEISKINVRIEGLYGDIERIDGYCDEFNTSIGVLENSVSTNITDIANIKTRLDNLDLSYADKGEFDDLFDNVSILVGQVSELEEAVGDLNLDGYIKNNGSADALSITSINTTNIRTQGDYIRQSGSSEVWKLSTYGSGNNPIFSKPLYVQDGTSYNLLAAQSWVNSNFHPLTTVDTAPTLNSSNLVTSGGVAKAVADLAESADGLYQRKGSYLTSSSTLASANLDKNTITIAGTSVSLGGSISTNTLASNLGLGNFLTGITSSMVTTALGYTPYNSANFTKTNIKSTLGISDWALGSSKPTYTAAEIGALPSTTVIPNSTIVANWGFITEPVINDKLANYLPLSGGTITGQGADFLTINRTDGSNSVIKFNNNGTFLGRLGYNLNGAPIVQVDGGYQSIIHSGNISSYAITSATLDDFPRLNGTSPNGASATGTWGISISGSAAKLGGFLSRHYMRHYRDNQMDFNLLDTTNPVVVEAYKAVNVPSSLYNWWQVMNWGSEDGAYGVQLANSFYAASNGTLYIRGKQNGTWDNWHEIAFTDSTVAAANKLSTPRTIWGQSFDGSGNVNGTLASVNNIYMNEGYRVYIGNVDCLYLYPAIKTIFVGYGAGTNYKTSIAGNEVSLHYGGFNTGLILNSSGNVGIGTTNPNDKLHVVGGAKIEGALSTYGITATTTAATDAAFTHYVGSTKLWWVSSYNNCANFNTALYVQSGSSPIKVATVNDLSSYLPKAGGTISGSLTFSSTSGSHIIGNANNVLQLQPGTGSNPVLPIKIAKLSSGRHTIYCDEDQAYDLGTSSYSYYYVYSRYSSASSDATKKNIIGNIPLTTAQIANAPAVSFTWKDSGEKSHGTIAQYWKEILPEFVSGEEGSYGLNYAALGVVSAIILARNIETHEQRIARLEKEISDLQKELNTLVNNE